MNLKEYKINNIMSIKHKFLNKCFTKGFCSENAVLKNKHFKPEVLFLGTFNPNTDNKANPADFFYGRNWFWPLLFSIAQDSDEKFYQRRTKKANGPNLDDILDFITEYKLSFADLICEILPEVKKEQYCIAGNKIIYQYNFYDLINDNDLAKLNKKELVKWNHDIFDYINQNRSLKTVYFTRKYSKAFSITLDKIESVLRGRGLKIKYLYTPSGQGLKGKPRYKNLKKQWLEADLKGYNSLDVSHFRS
jgi:hypothetical protein